VSDTILRLHATDPEYQPDEEVRTRARDAAAILFPGADQIDIKTYGQVTLIDCGENLTRIACPHCGATLSGEWWAERLSDLADGKGWEPADVDAPLSAPCCQQDVSLRTLHYDWPVGFARFTVDIRNPEPWPDEATVPAKALSEAIGVPMSGLWAHY
jgi:hypothetical protein